MIDLIILSTKKRII